MDNEGLITLTKCDNTIAADEIASKLASNGITASLHDELNDPAYGAYGPNPGIAVKVFKKDYEQSLRILKEIRTSRSEQLPWCPRCGSEISWRLLRLSGYIVLSYRRLYCLVAFCWFCQNKATSTTNAQNVAKCLRNNHRKNRLYN